MELFLDFSNTLNQLGSIFTQKVTLYIDTMVDLKLAELMNKPQPAQIQEPAINFKQEESFTQQEKQNNEIQLQQVQEQIAKKKRQQKKRQCKNMKVAKEVIEINLEEEKVQNVVKQKKPQNVYNVFMKVRAKQLAHMPPGKRYQQCISDWKSLTEAEKYVYYQMLEKDIIQVKKEKKDQKQISQFFPNQAESKKIQM